MLGGSATGLPGSALIADSEVLFRRYSRRNPHHVVDEANGRQRLSSGALVFDDDGCSCYREQVLIACGCSRDDVPHPSYPDVAAFVAGDVRSLPAGPESSQICPFDVIAAPWPDGREGAPPLDEAHALITQADMNRRAGKRARTALAQIARVEG